MNICVVTPYFQTDLAWLQLAHDSVKAQSVPAHHVVVCDGSTPAQIEGFQGSHVLLPRNYRDYGNTPRLIGCYHAMARGADAIAFLDADNWYQPNHLQDLARFASDNDLGACSSARMLVRLDGSPMMRCPQVDGQRYIDTSCLLVTRAAFPHLIAWVLCPQTEAATADNRLWQYMRRIGVRLGFCNNPTLAYRTRHEIHYKMAGEAPPPEAMRRTDLSGDNYR
jgi:glycosyltransferase involved in cell wall biosynthesis